MADDRKWWQFNRKRFEDNWEETKRFGGFGRRGGNPLRPFHPSNDRLNYPPPDYPEPYPDLPAGPGDSYPAPNERPTATEARIAELRSLLDRGIISGHDFEEQKDRILRETS